MDVVSNNYLPGDSRLVDHIVYELKAQGIFDNFRKECIADVDTKPAYQNLRQRVEGSVTGFLRTQQWRPDMNKNQVREMLRKNISESGFLETGVERIVDQVVNPKINTIFLPQVENVVYKVLGIQKPSAFDDLKAEKNQKELDAKPDISSNNLLPSYLEAVSPESEPQEKKMDTSNESQKLNNSKLDDYESPPFEPLEESSSFMAQEDNSVDSHLSGFSGLASHDSNHSFDASNKIVTAMEISNQDSQFSKQSSDDHLSVVMSDETETKIEVNEDSSFSKISKTTDSNSKSFDFVQDTQASSDKSSQSSFKQEKSKGDEKRVEKHRSSDKHKSRHDSKDRKHDKEKKTDSDKKESKDKTKYSSKDSKERDKDKKERNKSESERKSDNKERDKSKSSSSKHSSTSNKDRNSSSKKDSDTKTKERSKDSKNTKEKSESSKSRDESKSRSESKSSHSSSRSRNDSKSHLKHNGKGKGDPSDVDKNLNKPTKKDEKSSRKDDKHQSRSEKPSSRKKNEKRDKDRKDPKKDLKKLIQDDHYSLKGKSSNRRSTDRDSSDGHSGTHSSSSSFADLSTSSHPQKAAQDDSAINSRSNSGDSGNSDQREVVSVGTFISGIDVKANATRATLIQQPPQVKLIKPKFASNIFEARRLMKIRKKLGKIEKQNQLGLINTGVALNNSITVPVVSNSKPSCEIVNVPDDSETSDTNEQVSRNKPGVSKKSSNSNQLHRKATEFRKNCLFESEEENVAEVVQVVEGDEIIASPLQNSVISKESWDAIEAKLLENVMRAEYQSYSDPLQSLLNEEEVFLAQSGNASKVLKKEDNSSEIHKKEDCLGLSQEVNSETQRHLEALNTLTQQLEDEIKGQERMLNKSSTFKKVHINMEDGINKKLPKVAIVDVTSDNEIIISPRRGLKRHSSDHPEAHNNNNKTTTRLEEDQSTTKSNVLSKPKKVKLVENTVSHLDFNLPLSPAESDKSFTTNTSDKRDDLKVKRISNINRGANNSCNQRYSTDDLYKPRLQFTSSRRRATKNRDKN